MPNNHLRSDRRSGVQQDADNIPLPPGAVVAITIALGFSAIVLLSYWLHFHRYPVSTDPSAWGPFGDYIGGLLNPVVAFCALLLLAASLRLQARELSSALREFKAATKLMARQSFEANLWQMLKLHHEFARGIVLTTAANAEIHGRSCFSVFSGRLKELAEMHRDEDQEIRAEKIWRSFILDYEPYMTHYLRLLQRILNLIESEANSEKVGEADRVDIETHVDTVRATLSRDELIVLFFWGITSNDIKRVLDKYEFLRNIEEEAFPRSDFAELYRHLGSTPPAADAE